MKRYQDEALESDDGQELNIDLLGIVRRRFHLIMLGILVGATCATIYFVKQKPVYESNLAVLVGQLSSEMTSTGVRDSSDGSASLQDEVLSTQLEVFRSPKILRQTIQRHHLNRSLEQLQDGLAMGKGGHGAGEPASLLKATYRDSDAEAAAEILRAIFDTYQVYINNQSQSVGTEAASLIAKALLQNEQTLRDADKQYSDFVASVPALTNLSGDGVGGLEDIHRTRLDAIERELATVRTAIATANSRRLGIIDAVKGRKPDELTDAELMTLLTKEDISRLQSLISIEEQRKSADNELEMARLIANASSQTKTQRLMDLTSRRRVMRSTYGERHPSVAALDAEIISVQKFEGQNETGSSKTDIVEFDVPPAEILRTHYAVLKSDINAFSKREQELLALSEQESKLAKQVEVSFLKGATLKANLDRAQRRYDEVFKRLQELNLTNDYAGFSTDLLVEPEPASRPVWPAKSKIALIGLFGGVMLGFGFALIAERTDQTFRDPGEVEGVIGSPILAHLPMFRLSELSKTAIAGSAIAPQVTAFHTPRAIDSETLRVVRTAISCLAKTHKKQVFLVTSPSPLDGKSTVISNIAVSMAQAGKRVLVVDGDMRRPMMAETFGIERAPGLSDYLAGVVRFSECLHNCEQLNLTLCPAGSWTSVPSELLESEQFAKFIKQARDSFDLVLIDSPPLLAVTDPAIISLHVDSCLLAVRIVKNNRTLVERAAEILHDQHVSIDGVIVNGRHSRRCGYGYTSYNYYRKDQFGCVDDYRRYYKSSEDDSLPTNGRLRRRANGESAKRNGQSAGDDRLITGKR
ncbi:polysaccharide biosynthesis tyrosine autokinase [Stieleria sp. ICT_E10.1]|uniref:GumC family protein n=1 Tax=Stieleria sedimenti TaxID=2976331 RepID=UPI0021804FB2|nr:polysaccharide biosynthesis tyrosine autokinase [Stieleria sedimenti]MCS7465765.1 polysaccharide biosynthesis tyrosine autokinase [Stieleria sedimenti]